MRVLLVTGDLQLGGAETVALQLIRALGAEGWEFTVAAVSDRGDLREAYSSAGARVCAPLSCCRFDPRAVFRVGRIIRRHDIDVVMILDALRSGMLFGLLGAALSFRRVAKVCWCHAVPGGQAGRFVRRLRWYEAG